MQDGRFVGGAVLARKRARRIKHPRPQSCRQCPPSPRLPNKLGTSDRFFASLLLSTKDDLMSSSSSSSSSHHNENENWKRIMTDVCSRAGVPFPSALHSTDDDAHTFFSMRASLVLEEARSILVEELKDSPRKEIGIPVQLLSLEEKRYGFVSAVFQKLGGCSLTTTELNSWKPGCVVEVNFRDASGRQKSILSHVTPMSDYDDSTISLSIYCLDGLKCYFHDETDFHLVPVTNLISEQRQFSACYDRPKVGFLSKLMGMKKASHIRFEDSEDETWDASEESMPNLGGMGDADMILSCNKNDLDCEEKKEHDSDESRNASLLNDDGISLSSIHIPELNPTQEKAASMYIHGPLDHLSLVQGPPGTGKTTFMTAVLCRTFLRDYSPLKQKCILEKHKRVLVAAPTNRAISVLAKRFLMATNCYMGLNVVLIGVEDALFPKDELPDKMTKLLRSMYVYTWMEEVLCDLDALKIPLNLNIVPSLDEIDEILQCAHYLVQKLERSIPCISEKYHCLENGKFWIRALDRLSVALEEEELSEKHSILVYVQDVHDCFCKLSDSMREMKNHESVVSELLNTANVIFSTLTSSGVSQMKWTHRVHELFIDEAAAATEPEIIIPLHLRPRKMLVVGDPKQLPASVTSQKAIEYGLDRSLLDRLMFSCGEDHVMLDLQYRMKPEICHFPSVTFYSNKLLTGERVAMSSHRRETFTIHSTPYRFIDVMGREVRTASGSLYNRDEAEAIVRLVHWIRQKSHARNIHDWGSSDKLKIITFYSGQVQLMKHLLKAEGLGQVTVVTVDSSQGSEADTVILSFVRSITQTSFTKSINRNNVGFLQDDRRVNVALTRARFNLFSFGDAKILSSSRVTTLRSMIDDAINRKLIIKEDEMLVCS